MRAMSAVILISLISAALASAQTPNPQWVEHLAFNVRGDPLNNAKLRQAIVSAIDRRAIFEAVQGAFPSGWQAIGVAGSWFPPVLRQHRPDLQIHPYDVVKAKSLLAEAGFSDAKGLPELELLIASGNRLRQIEGEIIKIQLAAVGIRARIETQPRGAFFTRLNPGPGQQPQFQIAIFAWGDPDPNANFLSDMFLQGAPQNVYGYRNADVTLLITDILKETDSTRRFALLHEAEKLILTDAPVVPLFYFSVPR